MRVAFAALSFLPDPPIEHGRAGSGSYLANGKFADRGPQNDQPVEENERKEGKFVVFGISCFETIHPSHRFCISRKLFWDRFWGSPRILEILQFSEPPATPEPGFPENPGVFSRIFDTFQRSRRIREDFRGMSKDFLCPEAAGDVILI